MDGFSRWTRTWIVAGIVLVVGAWLGWAGLEGRGGNRQPIPDRRTIRFLRVCTLFEAR
jgi:hypothetical protein